jgi:hypothetical protein
MKIELTLVVELNDSINPTCNEEKDFIFNVLFNNKNSLYLHSNEIGDEIGNIVELKNVHVVK